jgi:hypothetical protein
MTKFYNKINPHLFWVAVYLVFVAMAVPAYHITVKQGSDVYGTLVYLDNDPTPYKSKSKIKYRYYGTFNFKEFGDRYVNISQNTFENAKKGDVYRFTRQSVYQDGKTTLGFFFSVIVFSVLFTLTLSAPFYWLENFKTKKQPTQSYY